LARGLKEKLEPELRKPMKEGRLLIVTPFEKKVKRITEETAIIRNQMMIEIADNIVIGYCSEKGKLKQLLLTVDKPIQHLILN
jgi:hypothetical protein